MRHVKSCGVLVHREAPDSACLLMVHRNRLDLPKGHIEPGESELDCALRELREETGLSPDVIEMAQGFRFETSYVTRYARFNGAEVEKTLVVFLARLAVPAEVRLTEHRGHRWQPWPLDAPLEHPTLDPLMAEAWRWLSAAGGA